VIVLTKLTVSTSGWDGLGEVGPFLSPMILEYGSKASGRT